ncbi:PDZ domain-containing protein [Pilibacter termitis]|uniref:PDZ domain-containing protein n=1 Tax=Pilibacter termitis TaxID=263852 RepID=A0A1T4NZ99_9ENTE|nr:SepM family pheromone-processing serine protease [Pilibacter termitis]SJZ84545.1 PDZ domain-containing protein [Pilibacter termitis]
MKWLKRNKGVVGLIVALLFVVAFVTVPLPYFIELPGPVEDLKPFVNVEGKEDEFKGSFNITTVSERRATGVSLLVSKFVPFTEIISERDMLGGATTEEYIQMNEFYMKSAQNAAKVEALKLAKMKYEMKFKGVYVMSISDDSAFKDQISVGDIVTGVNGKSFKSSKELVDYVHSQKIGNSATVEFTHDGKKKNAKGKLMKLPGTKFAGIGITLVDNTEITSEVPITYEAYGITGPSGGLMLTLETYTKITGKDIRKGKKIAGTGTMDFDGEVGRIGGIDKKVASASKQGAEIFFAPDDEITKEMKKYDPEIQSNYKEALAAAKKLKTKMKIIPVKTAKEALEYLEGMK